MEGLPADQRGRIGYRLHGFGHDEHVAAFDDLYRVIDEEIDPRYIFDLTPLSGIPENFHDHVHPTVVGSQRIASLVASHILAVLEGAPRAADGSTMH